MLKAKVLFLCTGNSARSQMAEALLRQQANDQFEVFSAGLDPQGVHPLTLKVLEELGIDASQQRSKSVSEYLGQVNFGYVITVCGNAEEKCPTTFLGVSQRLHWPFDDPASVEGTNEEQLLAFRQVRDQINIRLKAWLTEVAHVTP